MTRKAAQIHKNAAKLSLVWSTTEESAEKNAKMESHPNTNVKSLEGNVAGLPSAIQSVAVVGNDSIKKKKNSVHETNTITS